jgi:ubiquinone/menaquinone biosynthesis C-methylase UbiE
MKRRIFISAAIVVCFLSLPWVAAQEKSVKPGINKPFENPDVKEFIDKFEAESREIAARSKEIVAACQLKPGMAVADVGAGTGLFTRKFASAVGPKGKVYAVDIAPPFLTHIAETCKQSNLKNVQTVLCDQFTTKLPRNAVDLVFICDTYHHFEFPHRTLESIHEALRPGGRVVLIDFERIEGKSRPWVLGHVRAGKEVFVSEVKAAGFKVIGEEKFLKENYLVRFEKVVKGGADRKPARSLAHFQKSLDKTFTPEKAVAAFGEPDRKLGSGLIIYEYNFDDGTKACLGFSCFGPINYLHHVNAKGERVVIPLK